MLHELKERMSRRQVESRDVKPRCRRRKHKWRSRGRGDALTYVCEVCGETRDKPPRRRWGASEAPLPPGGGGGAFGGGF